MNTKQEIINDQQHPDQNQHIAYTESEFTILETGTPIYPRARIENEIYVLTRKCIELRRLGWAEHNPGLQWSYQEFLGALKKAVCRLRTNDKRAAWESIERALEEYNEFQDLLSESMLDITPQEWDELLVA